MNRSLIFLALGLMGFDVLVAQGPLDGYLKGKGALDVAPSLSVLSAQTYEGANTARFALPFRGTLVSVFGAYGLGKNLDVVATASYLATSTQAGLQDGGVFLKGRFGHWQPAAGWQIHLLGAVGFTFPLSNYPVLANGAIGVRAVTIPLRGLAQIETPWGLFLNLVAGPNWRLDQPAAADVATLRQQQPNYVPIDPPNFNNFLVRAGFPAANFYVDAWYERQIAQGGADFDPTLEALPQTYGVDYHQVGGTFYYSENQRLGVVLSGGKILSGRNVSHVLRLTGGLVLRW